MTSRLLPHFAANTKLRSILFVGVRRYTIHYARFFEHANFVTIDWDEAQSIYGSKNHICGDIRRLSHWREYFADGLDLVVLNGVLGFGINSASAAEETCFAIAENMKSGGILVVGYNPISRFNFSLDEIESLARYYISCPLWQDGHDCYSFDLPLLPEARHEYRFYMKS